MMFHSRAAQTPILAAGSALALMTAVLGDIARAETNLDASYTISFARIRVGDITATVAFGDSEYAISANGRAGGVVKILLDGEGSFTTRGTITDSHPVPTKFTSKIVSNTGNSDVTMVLDEGSVKELAAAPLPSSGRVPVTEANRQGIVDPLTAMMASVPSPGSSNRRACRAISKATPKMQVVSGSNRAPFKYCLIGMAAFVVQTAPRCPRFPLTDANMEPGGHCAHSLQCAGTGKDGGRVPRPSSSAPHLRGCTFFELAPQCRRARWITTPRAARTPGR